MEYEREYRLAVEAAKQAGDYLEEHAVKVDAAVGKDIKLENDRKSEELIIGVLQESGFPILSEERGMTRGFSEASMKWIVDPLDGSANLWKGMKELTCVSIALWKDEEPLIGVVNRFHIGELFSGMIGYGAFLNGEPIRTSSETGIDQAVLATGFPVKRSYDTDSLNAFIRQIQSFKKVRMLGAAAIMGAFVSCGRIDVYREEDIMLWDIAASSALVKAAGGSIEIEMTGEGKCNCGLYANESLKQSFISLLKRETVR